jgi:putative membrane protein
MYWDGHMAWMWLWWVFVALIVAGIAWLVVLAARRNGGRPPDETPEQILKRRYARGEIDRETYERMREDLRK